MATTLYLIRHSEVCSKSFINSIKNDISFQDNIERSVLSVVGEARASKLSKLNELKNIDAVYSSNYAKAIGTAKYIADENNIILNIDDRLNERRIGNIENVEWNEFNREQMKDFDYKLPEGESINETKQRIVESVKNILMFETDNRVAVVSHSTALTCLLSAWCDVGKNYQGDLILSYKDDTIMDGDWTAPMMYKVVFDGMTVLSLEVIDISEIFE